MRYWQVSTRRLSRAAHQLEHDGDWHPWRATPNSWYRVWEKKIVQRATFDSSDEEKRMLPLVKQLPALRSLEQDAGFREDMRFTLLDDALNWSVLLGYPLSEEGAQFLASQLATAGVGENLSEGLLYAMIPIASLTTDELQRAQGVQFAVKALYEVIQNVELNDRVKAAAAFAFRRATS